MSETSNDMVMLVSRAVNAQELTDLRARLAEHLDVLISTDFLALVRLLYRLDISEKKLKMVLAETEGKNASETIADMIIERQMQKIRSRAEHKKRNDNIPDDEKW